MKLALHNPFSRRRPIKVDRSFVRYRCAIDGVMTLLDRMVTFEGRVVDLSRGGALFRPRLAYIMRRADVPICIALGDEEMFGHIVGTSPAGFSIRFDEAIAEDIFDNLTTAFRVSAAAAAAAMPERATA